jgi:hypothetical protein
VAFTGGMASLMLPSGSAAIVTLGGSTPGPDTGPPPEVDAAAGHPAADAASPPQIDAAAPPSTPPPSSEPSTPPSMDAAAPIVAPPAAASSGCHCNLGQRGRPSLPLLVGLAFAVAVLRRSARSR